ncbi:MFS transporter [Actinoplanes sp. NPDC051851]|uniref:MFS transporter n=1 Tax=Actinoplanes sp. NPDC051851 TaxID=3154753 RepID=UPI0034134750
MSGALAPFRHAPFRMLLAGRAVTTLGNSFATIALAFAVLDLTGSARDLSLVVGARTLANVLAVLFGGVLADRFPRGRMLVGEGIVATLSQGAVAAMVLTGTATVPALIVFSVINGAAAAMAWPATAALVPQTVPGAIRQQAIALNRLVGSSAAIVGSPLGGVVVAGAGAGWAIAADAATFAISAIFFAALRLPARSSEGGERSGVLADLRAGWSAFWSRSWLWAVVAGFCVINASWGGAIQVLGPVVADQTVGRRAWGLILAAMTAGMMAGGVVALRLRLRRMLLVGVVATGFLMFPVLVLALRPALPVLLATMFLAGLMLEQFGVAWETTMQEHVPQDVLARVYSYDMLGSLLAVPLGVTAAGAMAEITGTEATLIGAAVLIALAVLGMLASPAVRTLRHQLPEAHPRPVEESVP